ncbi:MAG: hypothetical protein J5737_00455 [Bacteroidales bacterium]|nr:hypothetical protein [Bacteroidales bacterium]
MMKTKLLFTLCIVALLASCRQELPEEPVIGPEDKPESAEWEITVKASKEDVGTKALDLVNDGATLNAFWRSTERVKVYKAGTCLGTLRVIPDPGEKPLTATLSGKFAIDGLAVDDELTLMIPRDEWSYSGQTGLLTGTGSIEDTYDYALATVTVSGISGSAATTTDATFTNQQSIYRFGFKAGGSRLVVKSISLTDANGSLVRYRTLDAGIWTSTFGALELTPAAATSEPFYIALRNESTDADTYNFIITGSDDEALFVAHKDIPAAALAAPGQFLSAKSITAVQPDFGPSGESTSNAL